MATKYAFEIASGQSSKHLTDAEYIKGGYFVANSITDMNNMPVCAEDTDGVIVNGSFCYCTEDSKFYQYNGTNWEERKFNSDKLDIYTSKSGYKQSLEFKINDNNNGTYYFIKTETYTTHSAPIDDSTSFFEHLCSLPYRQLVVKPVYHAVVDTDEHITNYSKDFKSILSVDLVEDRSLNIPLDTNFDFPASWLEFIKCEVTPCDGYLKVDGRDIATVIINGSGILTDFSHYGDWGRIGVVSKAYAQSYMANGTTIPRPVYQDPNNQYHKIAIEEDLDATKTEIWADINANSITVDVENCGYAESGPSDANNYPILFKSSTSTATTAGKPYFDTLLYYNPSGNKLFTHNLSTNSISTTTLIATGEVQASSFYATSDKRKKENIKEFIPQKSILDLPIVEFDFKDSGIHQIGCIAQDLQEICPEIVNTDENGYLSINESKIVYLLLDEVKKLKQEVAELKGK